MSLEQLLVAAQILEEREQLKSKPQVLEKRPKKTTKRSPSYSRSTHNQLEKNRRAHLRDCLEMLKEIVPTPPDHPKATTLALLQAARQYIKVLELSEKEALEQKKKLYQQKYCLQKKLDTLKTQIRTKFPLKFPKTHSESESSEEADVDVDVDIENIHDENGYVSSESEERCSNAGSDGGLTADTRER